MSPTSCQLRRGRYSGTGHAYLLTVCCHQRHPLLQRECAAGIVLDSAQWLDQKGRMESLAVVVMPDHVHLVMRLTTEPLATLMRSMKSFTAHEIKRALVRNEPVWQRGYHDRGLRDEKGIRAAVDYCLQNPVRAGLVDDFHQHPHWWCRWEV
ncbi:transposase [Pseudoxanthomonas sp. UTMC 1351]|uniref:REP-associated tyrosine transposase n=1 Tax=Pseudoxanthomonas sp. UTMC 1351 TaxID=2695853 RepID=UPI0034CF5D73